MIISVPLLIGIFAWRLWNLQFATTPDAFGLFGDYVGGVIGAVTGLVSIIFLYFTYMKQIEIFQEQQKQTKLQQFETNYFHLLDNFRNLFLHLNNQKGRNQGYDYIHSVRALIEKQIDEVCNEENALTDINALETRKAIGDIYQAAFMSESDQLGHYFRSLYHILKYIDERCPKEENKKMYFDLVQAQMNTDELYLTCINAISNYGRKKMHPLLNQYSFLENLAIDENESIQKLVYFYYPKTKRKNITGIRKNVIVIAGTEGSRKGILASMLLAEHAPVRVTSVMEMIIRAFHIKKKERLTDIIGNQHVIKEMLSKTIDPDDDYVISCNFSQLMQDGTNVRIPLNIYDSLNPIAVIMLRPNMDYMIQSILHDDRVTIDETFAELYLENEETAASDYAALKNAPFYIFNSHELEKVVEKILQLVKKNS